jgi:hypothetical protein
MVHHPKCLEVFRQEQWDELGVPAMAKSQEALQASPGQDMEGQCLPNTQAVDRRERLDVPDDQGSARYLEAGPEALDPDVHRYREE